MTSLVALPGCGKSDVAYVSGEVTLDGRPLDTGTVTFHPLEGGAAGYGDIQEDGDYQIQRGREDGLVPGKYVATVVAVNIIQLPNDSGQIPGKPIVPVRYARRETSPLRYTLVAGRQNIGIALNAP